MEIYLVGGAVRDQLLGVPITEHDWVVVGATEADMLVQGYMKVGKDFPVFLHPETKEEYALARTERKTGLGYYGFSCYAAPDVTLEQDLMRRDLTINAMAQDALGNIIDPYHGQQDVKQKILRHVSTAFSEDPLRILRVARFAARLNYLGFTVADETLKLMQEMVNSGEIDELVPERVWQEWQRSLTSPSPVIFLETLNKCGALARLFPELMPSLTQTLDKLKTATQNTLNPIIRFAATVMPSPALTTLCQRYRVPNEYRELAEIVQRFYAPIKIPENLTAETLLTLLSQLDAWRRPDRFKLVIETYQAMAPQYQKGIELLARAYAITYKIKPTEFVEQGLQGADIQKAVQQKRLAALQSKLIN
jgi:tRNA nucleotidyltransferase (CCA-adding enzyme)